MDIILSPGFGSCLDGDPPRPGTANEDLAEQIAKYVAEHGQKNCVLITAIPVTIALNTRDILPDLNVPLANKVPRDTPDFLDFVFTWLTRPSMLEKFGAVENFTCFVAAQRMQRETMIEQLRVLYGVHAQALSDEEVRPDPESVPPFTRSLVRFWLHEKIAGLRGVGRY